MNPFQQRTSKLHSNDVILSEAKDLRISVPPMNPVPTLASAQSAESRLLVQTYARNPLLFTRGEGVYLYDDAGHRYLDLLSGIGVCALGHAHPAITRAIAAQAATLTHTSNLYFTPHTAALAERLTRITGLDRVFLCNSGTEAWEAALKFARAHAGFLRSEGKSIGTNFLALEHSFHGRSMGSVSTTQKSAYREPFAPLIPTVDFIPFNDTAALRAAFSDEVCAICIEVIQGEGGINPVSEDFLRTARELCDSTGALLLLDEIQSGMGRTGEWMAYQHFDVRPDITTLAKPLANGLPIGAVVCTDEVARAITPGMHGTTFGGNPLACATAIATIDELERADLLNHNRELGDYFLEALHRLAAKYPDAIADVRGRGLMIGLDIRTPELAKALLDGLLVEHRILINRTHDTVLRFLPPYIITRDHVDQLLSALDALLAQHPPAPTQVPADSEVVHA